MKPYNLSLEWKPQVSLSLVSSVQPGVLTSVSTKVEWMREEVIHKNRTRCIVESLQAGTNKRRITNVNTTC